MHIRPITRADLPAAAALSVGAFSTDALHNLLFPLQHTSYECYRTYVLMRLKRRFASEEKGYVVVTDAEDGGEPGEVVGYGFFEFEGGKLESEEKRGWFESAGTAIERTMLSYEEIYHTYLNPALRQSALPQFTKEIEKLHPEEVGPHWYVSIIGVKTTHQRRGIGAMFIRQGQELARESGVPLTLGASKAGRGLYKKCGFEVTWEGTVCGIEDCTMIWRPS